MTFLLAEDSGHYHELESMGSHTSSRVSRVTLEVESLKKASQDFGLESGKGFLSDLQIHPRFLFSIQNRNA